MEEQCIMRKVLLVLVVLVVAVAALGFYREWWHFGSNRDPESGKVKVDLEIDQNKIKQDAARARQKLSGTPTAAEQKPSGP
jgi:hypothetical protein